MKATTATTPLRITQGRVLGVVVAVYVNIIILSVKETYMIHFIGISYFEPTKYESIIIACSVLDFDAERSVARVYKKVKKQGLMTSHLFSLPGGLVELESLINSLRMFNEDEINGNDFNDNNPGYVDIGDGIIAYKADYDLSVKRFIERHTRPAPIKITLYKNFNSDDVDVEYSDTYTNVIYRNHPPIVGEIIITGWYRGYNSNDHLVQQFDPINLKVVKVVYLSDVDIYFAYCDDIGTKYSNTADVYKDSPESHYAGHALEQAVSVGREHCGFSDIEAGVVLSVVKGKK